MTNIRVAIRTGAALLSSVFSVPALATVDVFENDHAGWRAAAGATELVNFDTIAGSTSTPITGTEFATLPGAPVFSVSPVSVPANIEIFVGDPTSQVNAPSAPNMLYPTCNPSCEGIISVTFAEPVKAVGALFLDVEADFASTGYSLDHSLTLPQYRFSANQGQASVAFLGIVSDEAFTSVDIHFTTGPNIDGALLDNLEYALVAGVEPAAQVPIPVFSLAILGGALLMVRARRNIWS